MDEAAKFEDHDIVWVKLGNCWWPGEVCSESRLPEGILKAVKKRPLVIVQFFDETKYEYVKNINNICKYDDPRKNEFIQKGLDLLRSNKKYMEKFPIDVSRAERLTDGDVNIVSREQFSPVKKISLSNVFSDPVPKSKTKGNKKSPSKPPISRKIKVISPQPAFRNFPKATAVFTTIHPLPPRLPNTTPDQYSCKMCPFTTSRCNIMIMHMKTHTKNTKDTSPKIQPAIGRSSKESQKIVEKENEKNTNYNLQHLKSPPLNNVQHINEMSNNEEDTYKIARMEPPKKRRLPKKPGLKHIILADWSEDDDEEDEVSEADKSRKDFYNHTKSNSLLTENCSPNTLETSLTLNVDNAHEIRKEQEHSPTSEKSSVVPKYRNIPKKDRRDIILSEFNSSNTSVNDSDNLSPGVTFEKDEINENKSENISHVAIEHQPQDLSIPSKEIPDAIPIVETTINCEPELSEGLHEDDVQKSDQLINNENKVIQPITEKQKEVKKLSCFDFKDDDDDNEDFLSSLSKLKQKYMSPDKQKSVEEDVAPLVDEEKKVEEQKDAQLAADIENLLNVTKMPELAKVEPEPVPTDVRGLPPKERGKRIFKSRNRSKIDKVETEVKTSTTVDEPESYHRQTSANDSSGDSKSENDSSRNILKETHLEVSAQPLPSENPENNSFESVNISLVHPLPEQSEATSLEGEQMIDNIELNRNQVENVKTPTEPLTTDINQPQISEPYETVQYEDTTIELEQTSNELIVIQHEEVSASEEPVAIVNEPSVIELQNDGVCLDDNESIDSTVVEVSEGNSNILMAESEHDLSVLAAAETLISMPNKVCTENRLEGVMIDYHPSDHLNEMSMNAMTGSPELLPDYDQQITVNDEEIPSAQVQTEYVVPHANLSNLDENMVEVGQVEITETAAPQVDDTSMVLNPLESKAEEPIAVRAKNQIGRKTAAKRQKRKTGVSESASADFSIEDLSFKLNQMGSIDSVDQNVEVETSFSQRISRSTRNKSKKSAEKEFQNSEAVPIIEEIINSEDASKNVSSSVETDNLVKSQSEQEVPNLLNISQNIDDDDSCPLSNLITPKKKGKGKKPKDATEILAHSSFILPTDSNSPLTAERGKRKKRRSLKAIIDDSTSVKGPTEAENQVEQSIETSLVYSHSEHNQELNTIEICNENNEDITAHTSPSQELQTPNELTESENDARKQMDLDFEKLDLAELQSQTEQQHILRSELAEEYSPMTDNQTIVSHEIEAVEEVMSQDTETNILVRNENVELVTNKPTEQSVVQMTALIESTQYSIQESSCEEYDKDKKFKRKRTRKKSGKEDVENADIHEIRFDSKPELSSLTGSGETESMENLVDSEENRLIIDIDSLQRYEASEDTGEIIQFNNLVKHDEAFKDEDVNRGENGEEMCHIFPDDATVKEVSVEKNQHIESEQVESSERNAAEQILDEISNLTSSIDIILDSERTNDDSQSHIESIKEETPIENVGESPREADENIGAESHSDPTDDHSEKIENYMENSTQHVEEIDKSFGSNDTSSSQQAQSDSSSISQITDSPDVGDVANTVVRKRNSHLKYTPPKTSNANNLSPLDITPEYEEVIQDSQIASNEMDQTVESIPDSSVLDKTACDTSIIEAKTKNVSSNNQNKENLEKNEVIDGNAIISRPPDGIFEPSEVSLDYIESAQDFKTKCSSEFKADISHRVSSTPMTINMFQFDTEPLIPSTEKKHQTSRQNKDANKEKHHGGEYLEGVSKKISFSMSLPGNESKVSSKRRLPRLKDQTAKGSAVATMSEEFQERFKVYSFDDQADAFDVPKKSKYSNSKENKSDRFISKGESKSANVEGSKSHASNADRPKHSRSRQLNLQNVSDVCIPKFPKIDRTKRPTLESQELSKNDFDMADPNQKYSNSPTEKPNVSNVQTITPSNKFTHQESLLNFSSLEMEGILPMANTPTSGQNSGNQEHMSTSTYGEIQLSTTALSSFTSTPAITSKKKSSRAGSSASRKSRQLSIQQSTVSPNIYDPYSVQQSFDVSTSQTIVTSSKSSKNTAKEKNSRKQTSLNIEESTPSFTLNQTSSNDKRGQVISSQTIVMTGSEISSPKGPVIKTCAGDPLFITSKGNLVSSNPNTISYSSGYFETKQQRVPELITSVTQYPITSCASTSTHHPATSQKATNTENRSAGGAQNRRGASISDMSKDSSKSACNLAEIKRLEQKPIGKVLTAHGFNEIEPLTVNVIHGKSLRENNVVDMPVLVPIGEPHTPTQRMSAKRSSSHSPKDVTSSSSSRTSKQIRNSQGSGMNQQNLLAGVSTFDQSGAHLVREHTKHDLSDTVEPIFNQQIQTTVMPQQTQPQRKHQQQLHHSQRTGSMHQQQSYQMMQQNQVVDSQNQMQDQLNNPQTQQIKLYHSQHQVQTESQQPHGKQFHGKRKKTDHEHMSAAQQKKMHQEQQQQMKLHHEQQQQQPKAQHIQQYKLQQEQLQQTHHILHQESDQQLQLNQLQHEQQIHQEQQLQLQFHQELQLQEQQLQLEQHLQQQQDPALQGEHQEIVIQQTDDGENIIGDQLLVQDGGNAFYVDLKNIVTVMSSPEGEIAAVQLANGQTLFVTQSLDGSENQAGLGDQTIQIDGQHLLLTDATALEEGIEVPGQEILVQSLDREVYQDGQLIGNVLQIETSEGIKLVEHPIEYQLINNAKTAATNETNAIMPPIMSALEIPSSKSDHVINSKSNETGLIGQNLDDSLAVIGVTTQSSTVRSSLELPITITNPAIAPKTSNPINIGNLYGRSMPQQSQISPTLSSQDPSQLTYELFTSSNVINVSQHNQHTQNIFSDGSGNFKSNECRTPQISSALENQCLNEIILQSGPGTSNRGGGIIQQGSEFIIGGEQVCDQFTVVESQRASDSNSAYSNPTR